MSGLRKISRLYPPFMFAFRNAFETRDNVTKPEAAYSDGERVVQSRKGVRAAITEPVLRKEVARNLDALFNTIALDSSLNLEGHRRVQTSILNFGLPDLNHRSIDELGVEDIKDEIETVIKNYEPRLIKNTVQVSRDKSVDTTALKVRFVVRADLACKPLNVPIEFAADLELESGKITIKHM